MPGPPSLWSWSARPYRRRIASRKRCHLRGQGGRPQTDGRFDRQAAPELTSSFGDRGSVADADIACRGVGAVFRNASVPVISSGPSRVARICTNASATITEGGRAAARGLAVRAIVSARVLRS